MIVCDVADFVTSHCLLPESCDSTNWRQSISEPPAVDGRNACVGRSPPPTTPRSPGVERSLQPANPRPTAGSATCMLVVCFPAGLWVCFVVLKSSVSIHRNDRRSWSFVFVFFCGVRRCSSVGAVWVFNDSNLVERRIPYKDSRGSHGNADQHNQSMHEIHVGRHARRLGPELERKHRASST
jgi:hypothetical protein